MGWAIEIARLFFRIFDAKKLTREKLFKENKNEF
jgi:hypothetical protein